VVLFIIFTVVLGSMLQQSGLAGGGVVAVINISGELYNGRPVVKLLKRYEKLPAVKAVVLRIDSPGGSVVAAQEIYGQLKKLRERKVVVASLGNIAASGAYYIACGADKIVAAPGTLTGSIGVLMSFLNISDLLSKLGIKMRVFASGAHKDMGSFLRDLTPEEEKLVKDLLEDVHRQFVEVVSEERNLPIEKVEKIQALAEGLVDDLGTLEDAISLASKMAGIKGEPRVIGTRRPWLYRGLGELFRGWLHSLMKPQIEYILP